MLYLCSVTAKKHEPLPGWEDNFYGLTGFLVTSAMGVARSLHCQGDFVADIVPVDMVINALLATAWQIHRYNIYCVNEV